MRAQKGQLRWVRREPAVPIGQAPPRVRPSCASQCPLGSSVTPLHRGAGPRFLLLSGVPQGWSYRRDPNKGPALLELEASWERQAARERRKDRRLHNAGGRRDTGQHRVLAGIAVRSRSRSGGRDPQLTCLPDHRALALPTTLSSPARTHEGDHLRGTC